MHLEILVEDSSGARLIDLLLEKILGPQDGLTTWRIHSYKGIGRIPKGLTSKADPAKRALLDQLPRLLAGYGRTAGIDAVIVVMDCDSRDPDKFNAELNEVLISCNPAPVASFSLAIEEMEAWLLGDRKALLSAYPRAKREALSRYRQDSVCGTWELLADAVHPGGHAAILSAGWPLPGQMKHEWVERIGPLMEVEENLSPSFVRFMNSIVAIAA